MSLVSPASTPVTLARLAPLRAAAAGMKVTLTWLEGLRPGQEREDDTADAAVAGGNGDGLTQAPQEAGRAPQDTPKDAHGDAQPDAAAGTLHSGGGLLPAGVAQRLSRVNFHGRTVSLAGGLAVAAGCVVVAARPGAEASRADLSAGRRRTAALISNAALVATLAGASAGLVDDLDEGAHDGLTQAKGLAGHLGALARGHVTTGVLKIAVIGAGALASASMLHSARLRALSLTSPSRRSRLATVAAVGTDAVTIASWANVHNLLDLRPGRALKVASLLSTCLALAPAGRGLLPRCRRTLAGGALGVSLSALPSDLDERTMLGDTGANALGALIGTALALSPHARVRTAAALAGTALVLASEKVSFSAVIDGTPVLAALDGLGRRQEP